MGKLTEGFTAGKKAAISICCIMIGVLCLAYFIGMYLYAGWIMSFSMFWAVLAVLFFALGALLQYRKLHPFYFPKKISVAFLVLVSIFAFIFIVVEGKIIFYANSQPESKADYVIILGAKVNKENVSLMLKKRLDCAYQYTADNPTTKIIVSGGQGQGEDITEAEAMYRYLTGKGVSADRILKEERSTSTDENIRFSKELITLKNPKIVVVTNGFHVLRSIRLCEKNGLSNVTGLGAPTPFGLHLNNYVREAIAYVKDYLIGNI